MTAARPLQSGWLPAGIGAGALITSFCLREFEGLAGMGLGLGGAVFGIVALWLCIKLMASYAVSGRPPAQGVALTLAMFALKLPLFIVLWRVSEAMGGGATSCFVAGVVLVYFFVVARAATQ